MSATVAHGLLGLGDVGAAMIGGYLVDRGGEDRGQVPPVVPREPGGQRAAQTMGVPGDTVAADRLGSGKAGTVQHHDSPGNYLGQAQAG